MISKNGTLILAEELKSDYEYIKKNSSMLQKAVERAELGGFADEMDLMVVGTCLHNLYNAFEAYFIRIAKFFENSLDKQSWHRDLLDRMSYEIPDFRPALIDSDEFIERLDELRRFRHLFRNMYRTRIYPQKLRIVVEAADTIDGDFLPMHQCFLAWLAELSASLQE